VAYSWKTTLDGPLLSQARGVNSNAPQFNLDLSGVLGNNGCSGAHRFIVLEESMNLTGRSIWQQATGDTDRDYSEACIQWGVILNGPGHSGPWPECIPRMTREGVTTRKLTDLRRFCEEVKDGDIVVLRLGTSSVLAVGQVVGDYEWNDEFGDVDGWDIQHVRRVRWLWRHKGNPEQFKTYALKWGDTTQRLDSEPVLKWLEDLHLPEDAKPSPLEDLPKCTDAEVSIESISGFLFDKGVSSGSISHLIEEMGELVRIAKWYQRSSAPSESETVTYLAAPLLRALGWTPQKMAIEWNRVDLALFNDLPREQDTLTVVVEVKKMDSSCLSAKSQAEAYAKDKKNCDRLIVTDGMRYGVYLRDETGEFDLYAYMNLTRLRDEYTIYECKGAKDALLAMAPEWRG